MERGYNYIYIMLYIYIYMFHYVYTLSRTIHHSHRLAQLIEVDQARLRMDAVGQRLEVDGSARMGMGAKPKAPQMA